MVLAQSVKQPRIFDLIDGLLDGDRTALIMAYSLMPFFVAVKAYLYFWYAANGTDALDSVALAQMPYLLASDMLLCTLLAGLYWFVLRSFSMVSMSRAFPLAIMTCVNVFLVVFCVASFKVNQQYGSPLTIGHLRLADDLVTMRGSIQHSIDVHVVSVLVFGFAAIALAHRFRHAMWINWDLKRLVAWPALSAIAVLLGLGSLSAFSGVYTYGLKKNPVVNFVRYYEPVPEPRQLRSIAEELSRQPLGETDWFGSGGGLQTGGTVTGAGATGSDLSGVAGGYNVVLIVLESTAASFIDEQTTPHLHAMKQNAVVFDNFYTTAVNSFRANYSIFYSDYMLDVQRYGHPEAIYRTPMPNVGLMEAARDSGYETAVFNSGLMDFTDIGYLWRGKGVDTLLGAKDVLRETDGSGWMWGAHETQTVAVMEKWLNGKRDRPFAAAYLTAYPHHPYHTPDGVKPFGTDTWRAKFRNSLNYVDRSIGKLLSHLQHNGLLENTIIAVVGDHGQTIIGSRAGHGIRMDLGEIQVPFFIYNPHLFENTVHRPIAANLNDVAPTLAGMLGINSPAEWLGRNLSSGIVRPQRLFVHRNANNDQSAVIENDFIYVNDRLALKEMLYRLADKRMLQVEPGEAGESSAGNWSDLDHLFEDWVLMRHLDRACAAAGGDREFCL